MPIANEELDALDRLIAAATPGPWVAKGRYIGTPTHMSYIGECRDKNGNWSDTAKSTGDSAFIAALNPLVAQRLTATIREQAEEIERLRKGLAKLVTTTAAEMPPFEAGAEAQDAWGRSQIDAIKEAEALLGPAIAAQGGGAKS